MEQEFVQASAPLPLKPRSGMEIFDVSIKVYRRSYAPLLSWSAITQVMGLLGLLTSGAGLLQYFLRPFIVGSTVCCIAGSVRGQKVGVAQCGNFTKPRYWAILGSQLLSMLVAVLAIFAFMLIGTALGFVSFFALRGLNSTVQFGLYFVLIVLGAAALLLLASFVLSWHYLVPVVVCMEPDKANTGSLRRAYDLLHGHWLRLASLTAVVGLAMIALWLILAAGAFSFIGFGELKNLFSGRTNINGFLPAIIAMGLCSVFLSLFYEPLIFLITTIFYLDLRVRKEALDLEWSAHATAPHPTPSTSEAAPGFGSLVATGATHAWTSAPGTSEQIYQAPLVSPQAAQALLDPEAPHPPPPQATPASGVSHCVNCGYQIPAGASLCPACNAAQP